MKKHIFTFVWVVLAISLAALSFFYKDGTGAMVAQVESKTTAISFLKPVIIKRIKALPGQSVAKGDTLVEVDRPDLQLDIDQVTTEIQLKRSELLQKEAHYYQERKELILNRDMEVNKLNVEATSLELELVNAVSVRNILGVGKSVTDSIQRLQISNLKHEIVYQNQMTENALMAISEAFEAEKALILEQVALLQKKFELIKTETTGMVQLAPYDGIIATVDARDGELVSPFTKVLSLFESSPTLIKALMNERISYEVYVDQPVWVESENRMYKLKGIVVELGARITNFPLKLEPIRDQISYGREVFIEIPTSNQFLNGENVYVYPAEQ